MRIGRLFTKAKINYDEKRITKNNKQQTNKIYYTLLWG